MGDRTMLDIRPSTCWHGVSTNADRYFTLSYAHGHLFSRYSHGFLFPSYVTHVKQFVLSYIDKESRNSSRTTPVSQNSLNTPNIPTPSSWALSSVSTFGLRYQQPLQDMTFAETVEALVEGSDMSKLREGTVVAETSSSCC
jgi:hypothetical protein